MQELLEILKILIPAGAVFAATYFIVKSFLDNDNKKRELEFRKSSLAIVTPIRLQAYERIIIFLERLHPNNLVLRITKVGMTSQQLHAELIKTVKNEYEHNISQQIYVSVGAWELVKTAKEETIKVINISSTKVPELAKGQDLAAIILQLSSSIDKMPSQVALEYLKREIGQSF
ncbi:MAG TPA: hypothetical protein VNX68_17745 [Nitrosopumilaceae archaeon]|jgi:hypothetical protein|nr:hypothetical protein [Nitrosopumilaceae archaeon]